MDINQSVNTLAHSCVFSSSNYVEYIILF